jgi:DNA-binding GntR family transcriptional regulator
VPQTTAERVAAAIRDAIMRGQIPPGTQLPEIALRQELGVSRNTVREALRMLTSDGLARHDSYRGVSVTRLTEADVHDIFQARKALELAGVDASRKGDEGLAGRLGTARDQFEQAVDEQNWGAAFAADAALHQTLVSPLGSERLDQFFSVVFNELRLGYFVVGGLETESLPQDRREHRALVTAVVDGDRRAARKLITEHLARSQELLLELMARHETRQAAGEATDVIPWARSALETSG